MLHMHHYIIEYASQDIAYLSQEFEYTSHDITHTALVRYRISRCGMGTDFSCFFFCVSRLSVHSDGLFVLLDLTNIIKLESGEKKS